MSSVPSAHPPRFRVQAALATLAAWTCLCGAKPSKAPPRPLDLNRATATELTQVPGIGPRLAERVVAFRREHGGFRRLEELLHVRGVGERSFRRMAPHLRVEEGVP